MVVVLDAIPASVRTFREGTSVPLQETALPEETVFIGPPGTRMTQEEERKGKKTTGQYQVADPNQILELVPNC